MSVIVFFYCQFYWLRDALTYECGLVFDHFAAAIYSPLMLTLITARILSIGTFENYLLMEINNISSAQIVAISLDMSDVHLMMASKMLSFIFQMLFSKLLRLLFSNFNQIDEFRSTGDFINHKFDHHKENVVLWEMNFWSLAQTKIKDSKVIKYWFGKSWKYLNEKPFHSKLKRISTLVIIAMPSCVTINCQWAANMKDLV